MKSLLLLSAVFNCKMKTEQQLYFIDCDISNVIKTTGCISRFVFMRYRFESQLLYQL